MKTLLYIIGEPGSGKTTLARQLFFSPPSDHPEMPYFSQSAVYPEVKFHFRRDHRSSDFYLLGDYREHRKDFGGTDALSMAVQPKALKWFEYLGSIPVDSTVLGEGDRLGNMKFFLGLAAEWQVRILQLAPCQEDLELQRAKRGANQSEVFLRSRKTKISNLEKAIRLEVKRRFEKTIRGSLMPWDFAKINIRAYRLEDLNMEIVGGLF